MLGIVYWKYTLSHITVKYVTNVDSRKVHITKTTYANASEWPSTLAELSNKIKRNVWVKWLLFKSGKGKFGKLKGGH